MSNAIYTKFAGNLKNRRQTGCQPSPSGLKVQCLYGSVNTFSNMRSKKQSTEQQNVALRQLRIEKTQSKSWKYAGKAETFNSKYSLVVIHITTNPLVRYSTRVERTGSLVFNVLWSYVPFKAATAINLPRQSPITIRSPTVTAH